MIHFNCVNIPGHFSFRESCDSTKLFEVFVWHFIVDSVKGLLELAFKLFNDGDNVMGVFFHIGCEFEFLFQLFFLVELYVTTFEEVCSNTNNTFDLVLCNAPFGNPLACVEICQVSNIFRSESNMNV